MTLSTSEVIPVINVCRQMIISADDYVALRSEPTNSADAIALMYPDEEVTLVRRNISGFDGSMWTKIVDRVGNPGFLHLFTVSPPWAIALTPLSGKLDRHRRYQRKHLLRARSPLITSKQHDRFLSPKRVKCRPQRGWHLLLREV